MRGVTITLVGSLALLAVALALTLAHRPLVLARTTGTLAEDSTAIAIAQGAARYCQAEEAVPRGTTAVRLALYAPLGPRVRVSVSEGGRTLSGGEQASGWSGGTVTVPVRALARALPAATVCTSFDVRDGAVSLLGEQTAEAVAIRGGPLRVPGRVRLEYLRPGPRSWASLVPSAIRNMALARAGSGDWVALVALALMLGVAILASRLLLRDLP
jgi:hypothetical protein